MKRWIVKFCISIKCLFRVHEWTYSANRVPGNTVNTVSKRACLHCGRVEVLTENHVMLFGPAWRKVK